MGPHGSVLNRCVLEGYVYPGDESINHAAYVREMDITGKVVRLVRCQKFDEAKKVAGNDATLHRIATHLAEYGLESEALKTANLMKKHRAQAFFSVGRLLEKRGLSDSARLAFDQAEREYQTIVTDVSTEKGL